MDQKARTAAFRALHERGCFVIPNPWDVGTARWLRAQGVTALATTSAGYAFTQGRADQDVPLDMMLAHVAQMCAALPDIPFNADFENGYADDPAGVAKNVKACVAAGVAGLSIEDATGRGDDPLYPFELAVERVKAARRAIDETGSGVLLTARAEGVLAKGMDELPDVLARIRAFAEAGADVLYAPSLRTPEQMSQVIEAAGGKPVNILVFADLGLTVADIARLGARRISIGAALARAAWAAMMRTSQMILTEGSFAGFADNARTQELNPFFRDDLGARLKDRS
jgi:2-methylisocitrate lyase-like PEP mutase family enzyme